MKEIKRYNFNGIEPVENEKNGLFVYYTDHLEAMALLEARCKELEAEKLTPVNYAIYQEELSDWFYGTKAVFDNHVALGGYGRIFYCKEVNPRKESE